MKSIKETVTNEIIINKSKFITYIIPIKKEEEIEKNLKQIKEKYKDATHHCYSYIINNKEKANDDKEPSGTAGMPILNVLKQNELTNILCIVIRYFGGIKLGAGGLTRAYSAAAKEALNKCEICNLLDGYKIKIEFDYENTKQIDYILKDINVSKTFDEKINYEFQITEKDFDNIKSPLTTYSKIIKKEKTKVSV